MRILCEQNGKFYAAGKVITHTGDIYVPCKVGIWNFKSQKKKVFQSPHSAIALPKDAMILNYK